MLTRMAPLLTRMARMLTRLARMLTRMTRWLAGSHIIHTPPKLLSFTDVHNYALRLLHMFSYNRKHIHSARNFSPGNKNVNCT